MLRGGGTEVQPELARTIAGNPVHRSEAAGEGTEKDQERVFHRCRYIGEACPGSSSSPQTSGISRAVETQVHVRGRSRRPGGSIDRPHPYDLPSGVNGDRAAKLERSQPAEHPDAKRGRKKDTAGIRGPGRASLAFGGLFANRPPGAGA